MQYSAAHNLCVYDSSVPERITACIPTARVPRAGMVAVPCEIPEMQTMRALGYSAVSPILHDYDWPSKYPKPFDHQRHMAAFLTLHPRAFNLSDIGTGKTLSVLWAADYLMRKGIIRKALVLSPLSTLQRVWSDEVFSHFLARRTSSILHGSREQRLRRLRDDVDFFIINHDGLGVGSKKGFRGFELGELGCTMRDRDDIDLVIVDEGSVYKDSATNRYKVLKQVLEKKPYVWWMTGTPTPNEPTDAWAQARIVRTDYAESYRIFQERTMMKLTTFKWKPKPDAAKEASKILQPSILFKRDECLDLPPLMVQDRDVELTPNQKLAFNALKKQLAAAIGMGQINAVNEAALRTKLIQVSLGAVYDSDHEVHKIDCAPRLAVLREIIEQTKDKLLIFAPLTSVINLLYNELKTDYAIEMVNGNVSANKRNEIFRSFQQEASPRIIVADPRTMAHGLTLTAAATIIWYGPTDMPEVYTQANGRINRPGQTKSMLVVRLAGTAIEREIFKRLDGKQNMQGLILKLIKEGDE